MDVLSKMVEAVKPGGLVLDLQVIRPNPVVERDGTHVCEIDGEPLLLKADAAAAAVDDAVRADVLLEEARDDHDALEHYASGAELIDDYAESQRNLPDDALPFLRTLAAPCVVREHCRLRRLRVQ